MKKTLLGIGLAFVVSVTTWAQTNNAPPVSVVSNQVPDLMTNIPAPTVVAPAAPSFWGGLGEAGSAFWSIFKGDTNAMHSQTWVAGPIIGMDLSTHKPGGGIAAVYPVANTPLFVGARLETINSTWVTPSIQVQLKEKITIAGVSVTPFGVGGTALVSGNVAAYAGLGGYIDFWDFTIRGNPASLGLAGDYEIWGGLPAACGTKRAYAMPALKFSF